MNARKLIKSIAGKILQPLVKIYLSRNRSYKWKNIKIIVKPGVFHPGLFFSTKVLLRFLTENNISLQNKKLLELGAGTGLISIFSAKKGAFVTASDISLSAIRNIKENAQKNLVKLDIIQSDLFDNINENGFDYIIINPPFYPQNPEHESDHAWYCGQNFDYFKNLFYQLPGFIHANSNILMVLSQDCKINTIKKLAKNYGFELHEIYRDKSWWEWNYIFEIKNTAESRKS